MKTSKGKREEGRAFREALESGNAGVPALSKAKVHVGREVKQRLDLTTCKRYTPPSTVLFHDTKANRIRGYYGPDRISHGCQLSYGLDIAIRVVLEWCWARHIDFHPDQTCPYIFEFELP